MKFNFPFELLIDVLQIFCLAATQDSKMKLGEDTNQ